ncbi:uncharacterized protein JCM6883_002055 [Sporobolomyces salmoneus]|uniref:uncharacterized protein n=1 Tax=Sporobolomyces salmoneus TaxID=183962 RepID=UPI003172299C
MNEDTAQAQAKPVPITPQLALDLRLRFLESLISPDSRTSPISLARRVSHIEAQLKQALDSGASTDAVRRFVQNYDSNAPLLSVAPVPIQPPDQDSLSTPAKVSLVLEAENEIRTLERDLREIETLHQRGVVEAGKLPEHEALKTPLKQLMTETRPVATAYASLEDRTMILLQQYNDYITNLSELFVSWNDLITEAETTVTKLEKQRNESLDIS